MKREEFIAAIGYQGESAIIDKQLLHDIKGLGTEDLIDKGLYKAAFCSALFDENAGTGDKGTENVLAAYNKNLGKQVASVEDLKRLFGVFSIPEGIAKTTMI